MQNQGIYKLIHVASGRFYVGSAVNFKKRFDLHIWCLNRGQHYNPKLQNAWNKYGEEAFVFEVVEIVEDPSILLVREQYYLDTLKPFYNIALSVRSPMLGIRKSKET